MNRNKANITGKIVDVSFVTGKLKKLNISGGEIEQLNITGTLHYSDYVPQPVPPPPPPTINGLKTVWNVQSIYFTFPALTTVSDAVTGVIDWGDGTTSEFESQRPTAHAYEETGTYTITVDCDITGIKGEAFKERIDLLEIEIPDNIISIGESVFSECTMLHSVILPNTLTTIGAGAFHYTSSLDTVEIPESVSSIGNAVFWVSGITHIVIPEGFTTISNWFDKCYNLVTVVLPQSVTSLTYGTFNYCTSLKEIDIPSNVRNMADNTFANTSDITIRIHRPQNSISGSPWRAVRANVIWEDAPLLTYDNEQLKTNDGETICTIG